MEELKRILIVDDVEIDREVLKSILCNDFEVLEADNGYAALQLILQEKEDLDAILLDISMPFLDGLSVLQILRENNLENVRIFMISAEATKDNVEKASQYHIDEFIRKPFDREDVLKRVKEKLGVSQKEKVGLGKRDIEETRRYIADLEYIYKGYLQISGKDNGSDERREKLMRIFLEKYPAVEKGTEQADFFIEMLCKAAYLCNIGTMLTGTMEDSDMYRQHTVFGADIVRLNYSKHCKRFVSICSDMCQCHHERYDGNGFPHGISGPRNSVYTQMCGLIEVFDDLFSKYNRHNHVEFDYIINQLKQDKGFVSEEVFSLLEVAKPDILEYYTLNFADHKPE